ncbi:unnamed protein product, partial [Symbiodinium natans]
MEFDSFATPAAISSRAIQHQSQPYGATIISSVWQRNRALVAFVFRFRIFLYVPAAAAWLAVVSGVTLDFRTPEEAKLEEQEAQRVERFFDVDHLPEDDYLREWSCKEQALTGILEKLMRSRTVQDALMPAPDRLET